MAAEVRDTINLTARDLYSMSLTVPKRIANALPSGRVHVELYTREMTRVDSFDTARVDTFLTDMAWPSWMQHDVPLRLAVDAGVLQVVIG